MIKTYLIVTSVLLNSVPSLLGAEVRGYARNRPIDSYHRDVLEDFLNEEFSFLLTKMTDPDKDVQQNLEEPLETPAVSSFVDFKEILSRMAAYAKMHKIESELEGFITSDLSELEDVFILLRGSFVSTSFAEVLSVIMAAASSIKNQDSSSLIVSQMGVRAHRIQETEHLILKAGLFVETVVLPLIHRSYRHRLTSLIGLKSDQETERLKSIDNPSVLIDAMILWTDSYRTLLSDNKSFLVLNIDGASGELETTLERSLDVVTTSLLEEVSSALAQADSAVWAAAAESLDFYPALRNLAKLNRPDQVPVEPHFSSVLSSVALLNSTHYWLLSKGLEAAGTAATKLDWSPTQRLSHITQLFNGLWDEEYFSAVAEDAASSTDGDWYFNRGAAEWALWKRMYWPQDNSRQRLHHRAWRQFLQSHLLGISKRTGVYSERGVVYTLELMARELGRINSSESILPQVVLARNLFKSAVYLEDGVQPLREEMVEGAFFEFLMSLSSDTDSQRKIPTHLVDEYRVIAEKALAASPYLGLKRQVESHIKAIERLKSTGRVIGYPEKIRTKLAQSLVLIVESCALVMSRAIDSSTRKDLRKK